ncbi:MAG: type I-C CRISPR-associated protein Cas8c/Csd1 [Pseudomonadota bacterium]
MTILTELTALYERRSAKEGWPAPGFSVENIGGEVVLAPNGRVETIRPLLSPDAKGRMQPRRMAVPAVNRTSGIKAGMFWDKTAYALGVTAATDAAGTPLKDARGDLIPGTGKRTAQEHEAFREAHLELLHDAKAPGLIALRRFIESWDAGDFVRNGYPASVIDRNIVFRFEDQYLHDLPEARVLLWKGPDGEGPCLVTGRPGPTAALHPKIKGVRGAQSSGATLVSFNKDADTSHGKTQGDNAPVSETAAFAYGTALNALLAKGSQNSLQVGDTTVAFWARGAGEGAAEDAVLAALQGGARGEDDDAAERRLLAHLVEIARGRPATETGLDPATNIYLLGLAPNAARLSVRFWHPGTLGEFAQHVDRFWQECAIEPSPFRGSDGVIRPPRPWSLLYELAARREAKNIPPRLGGGLMRAVLTGAPYPRTLLSGVIGRIRADRENPDKPWEQRDSDGRRAAIIRAVLLRDARHSEKREVAPMALDEDSTDVAYLLGRLFGAYAYAERSYQARGAGLRDKYMAAASATPARVFPVLMRGYEHNLSALRKAGGNKAGAGVKADRAVSAIIARLSGGDSERALPAALPLEDQGRFFIGFYHQFNAFFESPKEAEEALASADHEEDGE